MDGVKGKDTSIVRYPTVHEQVKYFFYLSMQEDMFISYPVSVIYYAKYYSRERGGEGGWLLGKNEKLICIKKTPITLY